MRTMHTVAAMSAILRLTMMDFGLCVREAKLQALRLVGSLFTLCRLRSARSVCSRFAIPPLHAQAMQVFEDATSNLWCFVFASVSRQFTAVFYALHATT